VCTYVGHCVYICRYNCNRYNEDEAKKARDAQEVGCYSVNFNFSIIISLLP